jgi:hypothetical protein
MRHYCINTDQFKEFNWLQSSVGKFLNYCFKAKYNFRNFIMRHRLTTKQKEVLRKNKRLMDLTEFVEPNFTALKSLLFKWKFKYPEEY